MPLFSGRKFKVSLKDEIRSAWLHLPWPSPGQGEPDDATRGNPFFRSYGTKVTRVNPEWDGSQFRTHGQSPLGTRIRPLGQFLLPRIPVAGQQSQHFKGVNGQVIAPANPDRLRLHLRFFGSPTTIVFLSSNQFVTMFDYQIEFGVPQDTTYDTQSIVFAASNRLNTSLYVAEEERVST